MFNVSASKAAAAASFDGGALDAGEPYQGAALDVGGQATPSASAPSVDERPLVVLKVGSSVLRKPEDVAKAVNEIYRQHRRGARVVAVVSAFDGHTNALLEEARATGCSHDNRFTPHLAAVGEARAAALTAMACERVGLRAVVCGPDALGLRAEGPRDDAAPTALDAKAVLAQFDDHDVVVAPGFLALNADYEPVLLGRGGSDMTAVFLAAELGADVVRLVKDVPGVFDGDPAQKGDDARLFDAISWERALDVAGKLVQPRALELAQKRRMAVDVAAVGADKATRIREKSSAPHTVTKPRRLRVALAGCGVVGAGIAQLLLQNPDAYEVVSVLVRDPSKPRDVDLDPSLFTDDVVALFDARPEVVIDALSSGDAGYDILQHGLRAGVSVVSANKQAVVTDVVALHKFSKDSGARFAYSAAIGGGAPMLETMAQARASGDVASFEAVLNGTVNFILDRLAQGVSFDDSLAEARAAGFAEEDPSADLDGDDAVAKVRLLAHAGFGAELSDADVECEPLDADAVARIVKTGESWKQVGVCSCVDGVYSASVRLVPARSVAPALGNTKREENALSVTLSDGQTFSARGRGAGRWPTAESVFADVVDIRAGLLDV